MSLFKGHATQRGFAPIKVNNPADKIRMQGERQLQAMRANLNYNREQGRRIVSMMQNNAKIEANNREQNFRARQEYADILANAKWKRFETRIQRDRERDAAYEKNIQSLLQLTQTGMKAWTAYQGQRKTDATNYAKSLYNDHGLNYKKFKQLREIDSVTWNSSTEREGALQQMGLNGTPMDVLEGFRGASGYKRIAIAETSALRQAKLLDSVIGRNLGTTVNIGNVDLSLSTAPPEMRELVLNKIIRDHKEKQENWFSTNIWETSGAWKVEEQLKASWLSKFSAEDKKQQFENRFEHVMLVVEHQMNRFSETLVGASGPQGVVGAIRHLSGWTDDGPIPEGHIIRNAANNVAEGIVLGLDTERFQSHQFKGLGDVEVQQPGAAKGVLVPFRTVYGKELDKIKAAVKRASTKELNNLDADIKTNRLEEGKFLTELKGSITSGEDVSPDQLLQSLKIAQSNSWKIAEQWITKELSTHQSDANDTWGLAKLQSDLNELGHKQVFTKEDVLALKMGADANKQGIKMVEDANRFLPSKDDRKAIKTEISGHLNRTLPKRVAWSSQEGIGEAEDRAMKIAVQWYKTAKSTDNPNPIGFVNDKMSIELNKKDGDFSKVNTPNGPTFKFIKERRINNNTVERTPSELKENLKDHYWLHNNPLTNKAVVMEYARAVAEGRRVDAPLSFVMAQDISGIPTIKTLEGQIHYYNNIAEKDGTGKIPEIPKDVMKRALEVEAGATPRMTYLLGCYNYSSINKAFCSGPEKKPVYLKPQIDRAGTIAKKISGGDYDAVGTLSLPQTNAKTYLGFTIENATIEEVLQALDKPEYALEYAGAYSLTSEQIKSAVVNKGVFLGTKFNAKTQDKLFQYILRSGGYSLPIENLSALDQATLTSIQKTLDQPMTYRDLAFMRPEVVEALERMGRLGNVTTR